EIEQKERTAENHTSNGNREKSGRKYSNCPVYDTLMFTLWAGQVLMAVLLPRMMLCHFASHSSRTVYAG
ncbi:hypothetical protein, partial [Hymenobacter sp. BT190]|uniref:hypothetical protein n=1 Tax=Hymenobacter sp. BT190 TaxID=2763505 RepID=UPI001C9D8804